MTDYCTAAELRTQIEKTGTTGAASDAALGVIIAAVSQAIDRFCNRPDGFVAISVATARIYPGSGKTYQFIDECISISALAVKGSASDSTYTSWAATDYIAFSGDPQFPDFNRTPYTALMIDPNGDYSVFTSGRYLTRPGFRPSTGYGRDVPTIQVTAKWGYALNCPPIIKEVAIALSARYFKQGQSAWTDTTASTEMGQLIYRSENSDIRWMLTTSRMVRPAIGFTYG